MRPRINTSKLKPNILQRVYLKFDATNIKRKLISLHGEIIPFRVLPKNDIQRQELFVLLREDYIPNHELKLFVRK